MEGEKMIEKACLTCNKVFQSYPSDNKKYCSSDCYFNRGREKITCKHCGEIFTAAKFEKRLYCSRACSDAITYVDVTCENCGQGFKKPLGKSHFSIHFCNNECKWMYRAKNLKWSNHKNQYGEKNPAWKGGRTKKVIRMRNNSLYEIWRTMVYERDKYICRRCNDPKKYNLNAHHIIPVSLRIELMYDLDNGITLCEDCHREVHTKNWKEIKEIAIWKENGDVEWRAY